MGVAYDDTAKAVSSMGSDAKDYDNDGRVDIFYNNLMGQIWALFRNSGDFFRYVSPQTGIEAAQPPLSGWSAGFIDYDNDGWKDLYSANGDVDNDQAERAPARHHVPQHRRQGSSKMCPQTMGEDFLRAGFQRGSAFGDLNNDGFEDMVVTSLNEAPRILMNSADNGNHWLALELMGTAQQSRRDRREGEAHHRVGPRALQPRVGQRRLHVVERQAGAFRAGRGDEIRSIEIAGRAARCRSSRMWRAIGS